MASRYKHFRLADWTVCPNQVLEIEEDGSTLSIPVTGMWRSTIYQEWLAAGNVTEAADPIPPTDQVVITKPS
jgi:hypothetical protein